MFRKLVSNLPFSPSLINQIGFYSKRLKKEQFTRKLGLIATILAILMQSLTFLAPAQATLAASGNDIIYNGNGKTKSGIISAYANNRDQLGRRDIRTIFNSYGINSNNLNSSRVVSIQSTVKNDYYSIGRSPRGTGQEYAVQIPNGPRIYSRSLHGWAVNRWWKALEVNTSQGKRWILLECGNIVTQNTKKTTPNMKLEKSVNKPNAKKGEKVTFTLKATNIGDGTAKGVYVYDDAPAGLDLLNDGLGSQPIQSARRWQTKRFNVAPGQTYTYRLHAQVTKWGPVSLTNRACVDFFDVNIYNNCDTAKVTVPPGCPIPGKENLPKDHPDCHTNPDLDISKVATATKHRVDDTFNYTLKVTNKGDIDLPQAVVRDTAPEELRFLQAKEPGSAVFTTVSNPRDYISREFSIKKGASIFITLKAKVVKANDEAVVNTACVLTTGHNTTAGSCDDETITIEEVCPTNSNVPKDDASCKPCPIDGKESLNINDANCKPCDETKTNEDGRDISCLELHKKARNITQQISNANGTKAKAGDTIEYTLSVTNKSKDIRKGFIVEENMEDVLEYADIIDANGAEFVTNPVKMLRWKPIDIRSNETINRTILIKIKSKIPATPSATSDPLSYDLKMVNVYGDTVQIELPKNPIKTTEQAVTSLPSTGLGTNMVLSTILIMSVSYFYFRNRLMVKELRLVKQQFNYGMGV